MHWHQLRSRSHVLQVFQVTSHIVGFRSVLRVVNFNSCRCNHLLNFDLYREFLAEIRTAKTGLFEVLSLHNLGRALRVANKKARGTGGDLSGAKHERKSLLHTCNAYKIQKPAGTDKFVAE